MHSCTESLILRRLPSFECTLLQSRAAAHLILLFFFPPFAKVPSAHTDRRVQDRHDHHRAGVQDLHAHHGRPHCYAEDGSPRWYARRCKDFVFCFGLWFAFIDGCKLHLPTIFVNSCLHLFFLFFFFFELKPCMVTLPSGEYATARAAAAAGTIMVCRCPSQLPDSSG